MKKLNKREHARARRMLRELDRGGLEVILIPAPEPIHSTHMIRAVANQNPQWFRKMCSYYMNCRGIGKKKMIRPRTNFNRRIARRALVAMIAGDNTSRIGRGSYAQRILSFIRRELRNEDERAANRKKIETWKYTKEIPF